MLLWLAVIVVTVFLDQLTKYLTILHLKPIDTLPIIEDVLHLTYVENTGAAFGMMKDARWVFMITSTVAILAILGYMACRIYVQKVKMSWMEALSLSFIVGGGIGNMIDRTVLGYVVDMIDCRFINFAVFNVADSFVCVGAGIMVLYLVKMTVEESRAEKKARAEAEAEEGETTDEIADETADETATEVESIPEAEEVTEAPATEAEERTDGEAAEEADHE
ncbi:MAG: signal peptidase II [Clostridia bacterium]|nr:signal peptidase II [Clostridia bacterium]